MSRRKSSARGAGVMLALFVSILMTGPVRSQSANEDTRVFLSPDGKYEASHIGSGADLHCQVKEIETGRIALTTQAQYRTPNDVKACAFCPDVKRFAAAYHYGHEGRYTWIGIFSITTGGLLGERKIPGWTTDVFSACKQNE